MDFEVRVTLFAIALLLSVVGLIALLALVLEVNGFWGTVIMAGWIIGCTSTASAFGLFNRFPEE